MYWYKARVLALILMTAAAGYAADLDLRQATIVPVANASKPEQKAVQMLVEEIAKRTQITLRVGSAGEAGKPVIRLTRGAAGRVADGYRLRIAGSEVSIDGNDARGVLFGSGHLLRLARMSRQSLTVAGDVRIETAPRYPLRGHQLGYRPKTNSYDAWPLPMWEQYIRDLAVFGTNAIELIPPRSDDDDDSPHFPLPQQEMMTGMSRIAADYGMEVWVWYPAMDKDYSDPKTVEFALNEWAGVLRKLPRVDHVFVPGGDPGHTQPKYLMPMLEKQIVSLRRFHPTVKLWIAPQGFSQEWLDEFIGLVKQEPAWLEGIVFGPQFRGNLAGLRAAIPRRYPIRHYPDITHSIRSQYPPADWDLAFALTLGREGINPRPYDQAKIFRLLQPMTNGFLTYSEGCNDDVNKIVWSALGWNPDADIPAAVREYARYFIGPHMEDGFAQGLLALERNWQGPVISNAGIETALTQFRTMDRAAAPQDHLNWRFQQAMYRAYYDAYVRARLLHETAAEERAKDALRQSGVDGIDAAERILVEAAGNLPAQGLRARVFELAEALFQSIRMQLSVPRYKAIAVGRGANLDSIDVPLGNAPWMRGRFAEIRKMGTQAEQARAVREILEWANPGPGGFYDDLGNPAMQPHLVKGLPYEKDPAFLASPLTGFAINPDARVMPWRTSWLRHAEVLNDGKLSMHYEDLDPAGKYKVKIVYAGESLPVEVRLTAEGVEIHPFRAKDRPVRPVEFAIPRAVTEDGKLTLTWERKPGLGGNGRGTQVAEVWLMRE